MDASVGLDPSSTETSLRVASALCFIDLCVFMGTNVFIVVFSSNATSVDYAFPFFFVLHTARPRTKVTMPAKINQSTRAAISSTDNKFLFTCYIGGAPTLTLKVLPSGRQRRDRHLLSIGVSAGTYDCQKIAPALHPIFLLHVMPAFAMKLLRYGR